MIIVGIDIASEKHDYFMIQNDTGVVFSSSSVILGITLSQQANEQVCYICKQEQPKQQS